MTFWQCSFYTAWEQRKLGEVVNLRGRIGFRGYKQTDLVDKGQGAISFSPADIDEFGNVLNCNNKYISWAKYDESPEIQIAQGDILFTKTASIGKIGYITKLREKATINPQIALITPLKNENGYFIFLSLRLDQFTKKVRNIIGGSSVPTLSQEKLKLLTFMYPDTSEQKQIGDFFKQLDSLIALHQRKPFIENGGQKMITSNFTRDSLFKDYFEFWIKLYKEGAVRPVTLEKYRNNQKHITKIIPNLKMKDFDRNAYQELLNQYALTHERQTVIDFHHQVKGAILDAVDDGLIDRDPTRKAIFKGKAPREKKQKYLNQFELHNLLEDLDLGMEITWDWLILLIAKTGLRFSEALGLTPADFDFARQTISVNKTWDYKTNTGFQPTKNRSSIRKVQMDWQLGMQFQHLIKNLNEDEPIFVNGPVCNSTPNNCLARHCRKCGIPEISIHGLRHTHASLLMFAGVSIASVSRRLGHSSITTTQKVYMHIISELENQDNDLVMRYLSSLS